MADFVYSSIKEYTPKLNSGEAEFFFIANDATENVIAHLEDNGYPYYIQNNNKLSDEQLFEKGYAWPEYIHRVYRGYNRAILESKGEIIVLVNSDHFFSPDWLENLIKYFDTQKIVTSQLVEPSHPLFGVFPSAIKGDFGNTPESFSKDEFINFSFKIRKTGTLNGGAYMPCMFNKDVAIYNSLYPEGNIAGTNFNEIIKTGDEAFFASLRSIGVKHITAMDSIVYHLKEGEKDSTPEEKNTKNNIHIAAIATKDSYLNLPKFNNRSYKISIFPTIDHSRIIELISDGEDMSLKEKCIIFLEAKLPAFMLKFLRACFRTGKWFIRLFRLSKQ